MSAVFPQPQWFAALGELMESEGESFRRLGYAETRFAIKVLPENGTGNEQVVGLEFDGYRLKEARALSDVWAFQPDFVICGKQSIWQRMLDEIRSDGRPHLRHTLNSLVLVGEELWLESKDQLQEDKFYRYNQTLQEFFNLASRTQR